MNGQVLCISITDDDILALNGKHVFSSFPRSEEKMSMLSTLSDSLAKASGTEVVYVELTDDELIASAKERLTQEGKELSNNNVYLLTGEDDFIIQVAEAKLKKSEPIRVYLAGPDLFYPDAQERYERLKEVCAHLGMVGVTPVDNELGNPTAFSIRLANIELIHSCDCVLANLSMFRGPEPDSGTAYECGFASALGKPIVGYTNDALTTVDRVAKHQTIVPGNDGKQLLDGDGAFIEDFNSPVNLMISGESPIFEKAEDAAKLLFDWMQSSEN